ncbi:hypothetical protein [uncultured Weissella sp.]|uniref:hypothetical protein n=1 Tax=uncultured Weissella sp. TaxID=253243 RepID=UPI00258BA356|nr:hypothetical protein [uncultured Weissella sp.]
MTFDEALEAIDEKSDEQEWFSNLIINTSIAKDIVIKLADTYAPTIEMTKHQYWFITSYYEKESVVDAVANLTVDDIIKEKFDSNFWSPLSEKEVVQAWLHPETIKVVDEQ